MLSLLKWLCLIVAMIAIALAIYFILQPKEKVQQSSVVLSNKIVDVSLSKQHPFHYHLTAQEIHEKSMRLGVFQSTLLKYLVLKDVNFQTFIDGFGEVQFQASVGNMDPTMHRLKLRYPIEVSSKSGLSGVLNQADIYLDSGVISIRNGTWTFKKKQYRFIEHKWYMAKTKELYTLQSDGFAKSPMAEKQNTQ